MIIISIRENDFNFRIITHGTPTHFFPTTIMYILKFVVLQYTYTKYKAVVPVNKTAIQTHQTHYSNYGDVSTTQN